MTDTFINCTVHIFRLVTKGIQLVGVFLWAKGTFRIREMVLHHVVVIRWFDYIVYPAGIAALLDDLNLVTSQLNALIIV